ncbi:MAG TPA: carboxypeptidase-like regulatory domain-containing protein [Thermoanaerobaculia bacterium]|nr:carboxypeptidase-like regulatory domain-containing protein [Thermoanaerobaculia bacterium]
MAGKFVQVFSVAMVMAAVRAGAAVPIQLSCPAEPDCRVSGYLSIESVEDPSVVHRLEISEGRRATWATSDAKGTWSVVLKSDDFWAPATIIAAGETSQTVPVWRLGRVRLRLDSNTKDVKELRAVVTAAPRAKDSAAIPDGAAFPCMVAASLVWTCALPAAPVDVSFRVPGYAPHYRWDVRPRGDRPLELGVIPLRKGGSLVAWLSAETIKRLSAPATASLRYRMAEGAQVDPRRVAAPVARATFTLRGMVQLAPLAAGEYVLEVVSEGFAPSRVAVRAAEGRELVLRQSIDLFPPVKGSVRIAPPLAPEGEPWRVSAYREVIAGGGWEVTASGIALPDGSFPLESQVEGPVRVVVRDTAGNRLTSRQFDLMAGVEHLIDLQLIAVNGTALLGDAPLSQARLLFETGKERITATTNDDGLFQVTLPRRGKWRVEGSVADESVYAVTEAEITGVDDYLTLKFPATEVSGWVVDGSGRRVAAAAVTMMTPRGERTITAASDGSFRFAGMPSGPANLKSDDRASGLSSALIQVNVPAGEPLRNVVIAVEKARKIKGVVRSAGNAVVGATIDGYAISGPASEQQRATSDVTGGFEFAAPESASSLLAVVSAPGHVLQSFTIPISGGTISLDLTPRGGALALRWPEGTSPLKIVSNGSMIPMATLWMWAQAHGEARPGSLVTRDVAPGRYQFCSRGQCVEGTVAPGGRLELDLTPAMGGS